ncbi:hypothetical protein BC943DRAFT_339841 [Umbelopsis sp. AD052]|nr:hypothetical protein BC943DRAFT_339841 [Umbelopsis sp. AD052]
MYTYNQSACTTSINCIYVQLFFPACCQQAQKTYNETTASASAATKATFAWRGGYAARNTPPKPSFRSLAHGHRPSGGLTPIDVQLLTKLEDTVDVEMEETGPLLSPGPPKVEEAVPPPPSCSDSGSSEPAQVVLTICTFFEKDPSWSLLEPPGLPYEDR